MVDILSIILEYLKTSQVTSSMLTKNKRPRDTDNCVTLVLNGGQDVDYFFNQLSYLAQPLVILYVRNISYNACYADASNIIEALHRFSARDKGIEGIRMIGDIASGGTDSRGRHELIATLKVVTVNTIVE